MRHEKEWYTCDRCGNVFDETPKDAIARIAQRIWRGQPAELEMMTSEHEGYISKEYLCLQDIVSVNITEYYNAKENKFHLCGKCRKDFERFMRNEL